MAKTCELIIVPLDQLEKDFAQIPAEIVEKIAITPPRLVFGDDAAQLEQRLLADSPMVRNRLTLMRLRSGIVKN